MFLPVRKIKLHSTTQQAETISSARSAQPSMKSGMGFLSCCWHELVSLDIATYRAATTSTGDNSAFQPHASGAGLPGLYFKYAHCCNHR